jgi:signal transduction histidine kinase
MDTSSRIDSPSGGAAKRNFRPKSLRARFTVAAAVTVTAVLVIVWLLLRAMFEDHIERLTESDLQSRLLELAGALGVDGEDQPVLIADLTDPRYRKPAGGAYWRIVEDGRTVLRSLSLWDADIGATPTAHLSPSGVAKEARAPDGSLVYLAEREVTLDGTAAPHRFTIGVALDISAVEKLQRSFERQVVIALAVIGVALSLGAWLQSSFGLRPLFGVRAQLARVRGGQASRMNGEFPTEVAPLVDDLNKLLERQEELVRRARERAGDLAHGLKTPLTILRITAQTAAARGETQTAASITEQIDSMKTHVERELSRARLAGATAGGGALADARLTIDRLIRIVRHMPLGETIEWRNELPNHARLLMDPNDFGEIVGNLLDNARKHAKSILKVSIVTDGPERRICFDDDGPGIPPGVRETIIQRGERATNEGEGSGLGLAIVSEALGQYGLMLTIEKSPLGGCRMSFPAVGWVA